MKNLKVLKQLVLFVAFSLTACSFHLRGRAPLPAQLQPLFISTNQPFSDFTKQLKTNLKSTSTEIVDGANKAAYTLQIISAVYTQSIGSISASTNTRLYTLILTVNYQLLNRQGKTILPIQAIAATRTLTVNANQVLGSSIEALTMKREMRDEVIQKMVYRLASGNTRRLLNKSKSSQPSK